MRNLDEMTITQAVLANNSAIGDTRLCEIMTNLVQNLHAFARDTKLTETEWQRGIDFLAQTDAANAPQRQHFALLSHVLGAHWCLRKMTASLQVAPRRRRSMRHRRNPSCTSIQALI